jgi:hypothetical protein
VEKSWPRSGTYIVRSCKGIVAKMLGWSGSSCERGAEHILLNEIGAIRVHAEA